jgi:hypothetical protein
VRLEPAEPRFAADLGVVHVEPAVHLSLGHVEVAVDLHVVERVGVLEVRDPHVQVADLPVRQVHELQVGLGQVEVVDRRVLCFEARQQVLDQALRGEPDLQLDLLGVVLGLLVRAAQVRAEDVEHGLRVLDPGFRQAGERVHRTHPHLSRFVPQQLHSAREPFVGHAGPVVFDALALELLAGFLDLAAPVVEPQRVERDDRAARETSGLDRLVLRRAGVDEQ